VNDEEVHRRFDELKERTESEARDSMPSGTPDLDAARRSIARSLRWIVIAGVVGMLYFAGVGWYRGNEADRASAENGRLRAELAALEATNDGLVEENAMVTGNLEQLKAHTLQLTVILSAITGAGDHTQVDESVLGNLGAVAATPPDAAPAAPAPAPEPAADPMPNDPIHALIPPGTPNPHAPPTTEPP
jgi:hypothetical protein